MEGFWSVRISAIFRSSLMAAVLAALGGPYESATVASKLVWIYNRLSISFMQVSKWGNSLAVRLPAVVVEALDLKEGDEIEISIAGKRDFKVARDRSKERALEQLRQMKWSFPPDFKFNREEINER
jgi:antitoxin MazE